MSFHLFRWMNVKVSCDKPPLYSFQQIMITHIYWKIWEECKNVENSYDNQVNLHMQIQK